MNQDDREFKPDWYSPTGVTIRECMRIKGMTREQLSCRLGESDNNFVDALLDGDAVVGKDVATVLASAFGATPEFWVRRDERYWADRKRIEG